MIIANLEQKKAQLEKVFSWIEVCFHPQLIKDSENLIKQFETEKSTQKHSINLQYGVDTRVQRVWDGITQNKACYPQHLEGKKWIKGVGETNLWMPYHWQDLQFCKGKIALLHEGEKACEYARSKGLISFSFLGAKSKDKEFVKTQLEALKNFDLGGIVCITDNDDAGIAKGELIKELTKEIDLPCLIVPIKLIYPEAQKGDDFADFVKANKDKPVKEIKAIVELAIEQDLEMLINNYLQDNKTISLVEAKDKISQLLIEIRDEADLNIELEYLRQRLDSPLSETYWITKIVNPIKQKYKKERAKLDIQLYLQAEDLFDQISIKQKIQVQYGYSNADFYKLVNYVEDLERTPEKQIWTIKDLIEHSQTKQNWVVPSLLPQGELLLLTAAPKVGKSILATEITAKVLTGGQFLGEEVSRGRVLYCFSDESPQDFGGRVFNLGLDLPEILPNQNNLLGLSFFDIRNLRALEKWLEDFRPTLIVLDSLRSISSRSGTKENDPEFAHAIYRLKELLNKYNVSGILIHHDNKMGETSGSLAIEGAVWGIAQLTNQQGAIINDAEEAEETDNTWSEDYRILHLKRARSVEANKWKLLRNPCQEWIDKGIYDYCGETDDPTGEKRDAIEKLTRVLEYNSDKWLEAIEINEFVGLSSSTFYRALSKLERSGKVIRKRSATDNRKWVYQWAKNTNFSSQNNSQLVRVMNIDNAKSPEYLPPPPERECESENEQFVSIDSQELEVIPTSFPPKKVDENVGMNVGISETVDNQEVQSDSSHSHTDSQGGGVDNLPQKLDSDDLKTDNVAYCEKLADSIIGTKVCHKDTPEIEGVIISEPEKMGTNFIVKVRWAKPRTNDTKWFDSLGVDIMKDGEPCWVTALISEEIDFQAWRDAKLNGG